MFCTKEVLVIINIKFTGICAEKCLNGGKCIQKDTCQCPKGFYGLHCEYCKIFFYLRNICFNYKFHIFS